MIFSTDHMGLFGPLDQMVADTTGFAGRSPSALLRSHALECPRTVMAKRCVMTRQCGKS